MNVLISKVQYSNYDIGEFRDEEPRTLAATIDLIRDYPWWQYRIYSDPALTGPSVTIKNNCNNYLKITIYGGVKFAIFLLSSGKLFLYNLHDVNSIEEVYQVVQLFFDEKLDIKKAKRSYISLFPKRHFVTNPYIYKATIFRLFFLSWIYLFLFAYALFNDWLAIILPVSSLPIRLLIFTIVSAVTFYFLNCLLIIFNKYRKCKNTSLQIAYGNPEFVFSENGVINTYLKNDVRKVIIHLARNDRGPKSEFCLTEVYLNDGAYLKFNHMILSGSSFLSNFKKPPQHTIMKDLTLQLL